VASPDAHPFDQPAPAVRLQFGAHLLEVPGLVREAAAEVLFTHSDEPDSRSVAQLLLDAVAEVLSNFQIQFNDQFPQLTLIKICFILLR
jgi:hypothetical protein